jgi:hypothetical protein
VAAADAQACKQAAVNTSAFGHRQQQRVKRLPGRTAYNLADWAAMPLQDMGAFLKLPAPAAAPLYKRMDLSDSLQQVLAAVSR